MWMSEARMSVMVVFANSGASVSGFEVGSLACKVLMLCVITLTLRVGGCIGSDHSLLSSVPGLARAWVWSYSCRSVMTFGQQVLKSLVSWKVQDSKVEP